MSHLVAVYGTLRRFGKLHGNLDGYPMVESGVQNIPFTMVDCGWYPALIPSEENNDIYLEMYEVDDAGLGLLDMVEGCPHLYTRESVELFGKPCFVYQYADLERAKDYPVITSGNFLDSQELYRKSGV